MPRGSCVSLSPGRARWPGPRDPAAVSEFNLTSHARHDRGLDFILRGTGVDREQFFRDYYEKVPVFLPQRRRTHNSNANHYGICSEPSPHHRQLSRPAQARRLGCRAPKYHAAPLQQGHGVLWGGRKRRNAGHVHPQSLGPTAFWWTISTPTLASRGASIYTDPTRGARLHATRTNMIFSPRPVEETVARLRQPSPTQHTRQELGKHGEHLNQADLGPPLLDIIMEQGDALYVPRVYPRM